MCIVCQELLKKPPTQCGQLKPATKLMNRKVSGFTLIELMVTVAIIGILAMIAYPSFTNQIVVGHRAEAQQWMLEFSNKQQQFLLNNRSYITQLDKMADIGMTAVPTVEKNYTFSLTTNTSNPAPNYTLTATPSGRQSSDGVLTINNLGVRAPMEKW